jgi:hypothetical protein
VIKEALKAGEEGRAAAAEATPDIQA